MGALVPQNPTPISRCFLEWMREDRFPLRELVTNRYSLEQIDEAVAALEQGQILGRAIMEF